MKKDKSKTATMTERKMSFLTHELGRQAAAVSAHTGLSVAFCANMALHRMSKRMAEGEGRA